MVDATLGLGGNLGDPVARFAEALQALAQHPHITLTSRSSVYHTAPWGKTDQPDFFNMAAQIRTSLPAGELLSFTSLIETAAGRKRTELWGPRTLDIDLLTFGEVHVEQPGLTLPHPRIAERAFVLIPLAEIAPGLIIDGRPIGTLLDTMDVAGVMLDETGTARLQRLSAARDKR